MYVRIWFSSLTSFRDATSRIKLSQASEKSTILLAQARNNSLRRTHRADDESVQGRTHNTTTPNSGMIADVRHRSIDQATLAKDLDERGNHPSVRSLGRDISCIGLLSGPEQLVVVLHDCARKRNQCVLAFVGVSFDCLFLHTQWRFVSGPASKLPSHFNAAKHAPAASK